jgi:hypothetical protein
MTFPMVLKTLNEQNFQRQRGKNSIEKEGTVGLQIYTQGISNFILSNQQKHGQNMLCVLKRVETVPIGYTLLFYLAFFAS